MALYTFIHRECPIRIWGIRSGQRIERVLKTSGESTRIHDLSVLKSNDSVLIFDGGYLFDDRLIRYLATTPNLILQLEAEGKRATVAAHVGASLAYQAQYAAAGAELADGAEEIFERAQLIVKVKEPKPDECMRLRLGQTLFTYLHLAPDPRQTDLLLASGVTAIAYETVTDRFGGLPLLTPMSEVAGRMSIQVGAASLEKTRGGSGVLLSGVPGVSPGRVTILGGGVVGSNAALIAIGLGAEVTVIDRSLERLRSLNVQFGGRLRTLRLT